MPRLTGAHAALVALGFALALAACGTPEGAGGGAVSATAPRGDATPTPHDSMTLFDGTTWTLSALDGAGVITDVTITLRFAEEGLVGSTGCNGYRVEYDRASEGVLALRGWASTAARCPTPELAAQERHYLDLLPSMTTYRRDGARLRLATADGRALLFAAQPGSPATATRRG